MIVTNDLDILIEQCCYPADRVFRVLSDRSLIRVKGGTEGRFSAVSVMGGVLDGRGEPVEPLMRKVAGWAESPRVFGHHDRNDNSYAFHSRGPLGEMVPAACGISGNSRERDQEF
jgi:hypothetical protein